MSPPVHCFVGAAVGVETGDIDSRVISRWLFTNPQLAKTISTQHSARAHSGQASAEQLLAWEWASATRQSPQVQAHFGSRYTPQAPKTARMQSLRAHIADSIPRCLLRDSLSCKARIEHNEEKITNGLRLRTPSSSHSTAKPAPTKPAPTKPSSVRPRSRRARSLACDGAECSPNDRPFA